MDPLPLSEKARKTPLQGMENRKRVGVFSEWYIEFIITYRYQVVNGSSEGSQRVVRW
jgi:hypothetical protein